MSCSSMEITIMIKEITSRITVTKFPSKVRKKRFTLPTERLCQSITDGSGAYLMAIHFPLKLEII